MTDCRNCGDEIAEVPITTDTGHAWQWRHRTPYTDGTITYRRTCLADTVAEPAPGVSR